MKKGRGEKKKETWEKKNKSRPKRSEKKKLFERTEQKRG